MSVSLLVVEDKERTRQQIEAEINPLNFNLTFARDGLDGLSKAKSQAFDMILIDHKMPVMDGLILLKNLRELSVYQDAPLFFMTTQDLIDVEPRASRAGATACFSKPLDGEDVRKTLLANVKRSVA